MGRMCELTFSRLKRRRRRGWWWWELECEVWGVGGVREGWGGWRRAGNVEGGVRCNKLGYA